MVRLRAQALLKSGKAAEANKLLEDAVASQPKSREYVVGLADLYADQKRTDDALRLLEQARQTFGDDQTLAMRFANVYEGGGRLDEAEKELRKLMAEDPLNADAMNSLSYMLAEHSVRLAEAVDLAQRALKVEPGNPAYLDTLGWALFKQGKIEEAAEPLGKAAAMLIGNSVIQDHHGDVLAKRGRTAEAVAAWQRALAGDGESIDRAAIEKKIKAAQGRKQVECRSNDESRIEQRALAASLSSLLLVRCCFPRAPLGLRRVPPARPLPIRRPSRRSIAATAACKGFRSIEGELSLSGRAGGERVRGRILTGLESGGAVRLEAVAPFGAPFFVLAGRAERATLVLPREHRVLKDTAVADVLERLTGLALGADDLRLIVSGCLVERAAPSDGRQWGGGWRAVTIGPDRVAYLRVANGQPVLAAADYGPWHVDYSAHAGGFPRVVRVRRAGDWRDASTSPRASSSCRSTRRSIRAPGSLMYHPTPIR